MPLSQRDFSGHLNLDSHAYRVAPRDYIDALNITRAGTREDVMSNLLGNRIVPFTLPAGINIPIGSVEDKLRNRIIDAVWNSGGNHFFSEFDKISRTRTKILQSKTDSGGIDILNFQPLYPVTIHILHREEGDFVLFNDGYNSPGAFNMDTISAYAPNITIDLIKLAKRPPLPPPVVAYGSDATVKNNSLRKKLFQFKYRWIYKDGFKSTWSPISKTPLPLSGYSIVTDANPSQNNMISVQVKGGGENYDKIEIAARQSIGDIYSDFGIVETLSKDDYNIQPGENYTYNFYNDGEWGLLDPDESELEFDRVPTKANAFALINNVPVFSGITEGYNQIPRNKVNVQMSYVSRDTSPNEVPVAPPGLSYSQSGTPFNAPQNHVLKIFVGQYVSGGSKYHIEFVTQGEQGVNIEYIATNEDTVATVRQQLLNLLDAALPPNFSVQLDFPDATAIKIEIYTATPAFPQYFGSPIVFATAPNNFASSDSTWKWNARYGFIIVYYDDDGKVVGVISQKQIAGDPTVMAVTTPNFNINGSNGNAPRVPVITASISHTPPVGAKYFNFLRTGNLAASKFLQYITCKVETDTDYIYFCIENLNKFRLDNSGFIPSYQFAPGDRIRIMATVDSTGGIFKYSGGYFEDDYEIVGVVTRKLTDGVPAGENNTPPAVDQVDWQWIKVRRPSPATTYNPFLLVEIYTPAIRATENTQVYYEFGEVYPIYVHANGNRYHSGNKANQDNLQNARFEFEDGDVYLKVRKVYNDAFSPVMTLGMMDANYSDYWQSAVNSNGRPFVVEPNARVAYRPTLTRFGQSYQQGVNFINGLNRFYPDNKDEYKAEFGDVMKLVAWNNSLIVCQKLKIGNVPVLQQIWEDAAGAETVGVTNKFLNPIRYYQGEYGVGDVPDSVAASTAAIYGWDSNRGVNWRLSQNGLEPISIQNNANSFGQREATVRGFQYKVRGAFNNGKMEYVAAFAARDTDYPAKTLVWDEKTNGYRSTVSYIPEMMCSINGLFCTWKNGQIYTHDSDVYNNFYGVQYESFATAVFNDQAQFKKAWRSVMLISGEVWDMPSISSNVKSNGAGLQRTDLIESDFEDREGHYYASFKGDINSVPAGEAIQNGDVMKGSYLIIKVRKAAASATGFVFLNGVIVDFDDSPYNTK